jgi:polysaccharide export outer membrane protein
MDASNRLIGKSRQGLPCVRVECANGQRAGIKKHAGPIWPLFLLLCCTSNTLAQADQPSWSHNPPYRLCESDVLSLRFSLTPEFNQTVRVRTDGYVNLDGVGEILVEGLTVGEVSEAVRSAYSEILHDPIVTIQLQDSERPYFIASGAVNKPGKYELRGYTSVTAAIAIAGGVSGSGKGSEVLLFRRSGDEWNQVKAIKVEQIQKGRRVDEDAEVRMGDMLVVPGNAFSRIKRLLP